MLGPVCQPMFLECPACHSREYIYENLSLKKKLLIFYSIHSMKIDNSSIERVEEFKYLGTTLTYQNSIQEEIKCRLKLGNACYYSVQNLLSSSLLSKTLKIKIYRTTILPVVLYGCETWSLTLREERRLRVFENRVLRRVFGPKRDEVTGEWRKLHTHTRQRAKLYFYVSWSLEFWIANWKTKDSAPNNSKHSLISIYT